MSFELYKGTLRYSYEVCEQCYRSRPRSDLIRKGCYSHAQHDGGRKVFVVNEENRLIIVRPFPRDALSHMGQDKWYVVCDRKRCRGYSHCRYAHSRAEADVWNTKLATYRRMPSGGHPYSTTYPVTVQQTQCPSLPVALATISGCPSVEENGSSWPDLSNVRTAKMQSVDIYNVSLSVTSISL